MPKAILRNNIVTIWWLIYPSIHGCLHINKITTHLTHLRPVGIFLVRSYEMPRFEREVKASFLSTCHPLFITDIRQHDHGILMFTWDRCASSAMIIIVVRVLLPRC